MLSRRDSNNNHSGMNMIHLPKVQRVTIIRTETASPKINPYTVYVIDVKLAGLNNHTVIRRYSEFMALYDKLQETYPNVKLYFPPKKAFGKLRAEVITQRKDQLQTFLNSICEHPKISSDFSVFCFLAPQLFPSGNKKEVPVAVSLITLPNELFLKCLLMISFKDVLALTEVCSHLFHYITTHPTLWLYLNARFDVSVVGAAKLVENPHATPQTPPKRTSILSKSTQLFKSSSPSPSPPPASAAVSVPSSGREPIQHSKSFSSFSTSLPNSQFAAFSLDNPNVSNLTTSSELVKTLIDTDSPKSIRRSGSQNQLRGSMMMRPHVVPSFHIRNGPSPTEFVYMGASESEYRKMFLQHMREFHKLRVNIARENKYCDCVLRKLVGTIIGDHGVGKTKLLQSCLTSFSPSLTLPSSPLQSANSSEREGNAGITPQASLESNTTDCHVTHILSNGKFLCFQLFDTTGENVDFERYQHLSQSNFVLVTFSVLDRASFLRVKEKWIPEVREYSPEIPLVVVGLKRDLREDPSIMCKPVQFQEAMETFYKLGAIHYAESPSPSEGVGGWRTDFQSWRVNLLSEIGSMILFNVNPHTRPTKSAYEEKLAFLHKLFPFKQIEAIGVALASCVGDMDQAVEFLVNQGPAPPAPAPAPTMPPNFIRTGDGKILSPRSPPEENDEWRQELRQSWKMEISRMDGPKRSQLINESVEAGLVVASGTWDDEEVENSPNNTPKKEKEKDTTASTAMKAKRAVYLDKLKKTSIDRFIKDFLKRKIPAKQQAEMTVSFLGEISSYVSSHTLWEDEDEKELQKMRDELERYVFSKIYKSVFGVSQEDTTKDKFFKERISKLVFITPAHLDISDKFWNTDLWDAAVYEINQIDKYQTPSDKLTCILNCCKVIIFLLTSSGDSQAGADDFLPHLIYVLIKANPPHLASNMEFIANYCGPEAMRMEKYYYFTTMSVGTSFIENIDASSLNIDPIAFEKLMNENT